MASSPELPLALLNTISWNPDDQAVWIGSSLSLRRNLARHNFPSKLPKPEIDQVLQTLQSSLMNIPEIEKPHFFSMDQLSPADRELIFEHFLFLHGLQEPPNGSALVLNEKGDILTQINTNNHLEIRAISLSNQWENTWNILNKIESHIGKAEGFAFSPRFGYLTSDPARCGTGLTIQAFLHLPALIHAKQLPSALANAEDDEVLFMGLSGNLEELIGDVIVIQNNFSIGLSEEAILRAIQVAATKLIGAEKTMRDHLKKEQNTEIKDLVSKAFGLIVHSFQLETKEALNLLSIMKLGLALGYISNISNQKLNELFFKCRRGYFSHLFPDLNDPKAIAQKRADFLQQELNGITLSPDLL